MQAATAPPPVSASGSASFNRLMLDTALANASLLNYFYGHRPGDRMDLAQRYTLYEEGCEVHTECYCTHASTSMVKARNTDPAHTVFCFGGKEWVHACSAGQLAMDCPCLEPRAGAQSCFMGQQSPRNLLGVIALARHKNITTVIEQGRYYGHSAFVYHVHGLNLISVELLPMQHTATALKRRAPAIKQLDGDGSSITVTLIKEMHEEIKRGSKRVAVIFDGEKREVAYHNSYLKVKKDVVFAVFDDTHAPFRAFLADHGETVWYSNEPSYRNAFIKRDREAVRALSDLPINPDQPANTHSVKGDCPPRGCSTFGQRLFSLAEQEWTVVQGGRWTRHHHRTSKVPK